LSIAATALAALMTVAAMWGWMRPEPPRLVTRQEIVLGGLSQNLGGVRWGLAVAPDGSAIVYVDSVGTGSQLMLKQRDDVLSTPLSGTADATGPFFSPDGAWIGFTADGKLRKVPRGGGGSVTLADSTMMLAVGFGAGAWLDNDTILYVDPGFNLRKVSAAGGPSTVVVRFGEDFPLAVVDVWPLPESRGALFTGCTLNCAESNVYVFDATRDTVRTLFEQAQGVWYTPTGHVVYADRGGGAFAAPFDLDQMEVSGAVVPVLEGVRAPDLTFGADGTLIYVIGDALLGAINTAELVWVDRNGAVTAVDAGWDFTLPAAAGVAVSPDGARLALGIRQAGVDNIWIKQSDRTRGPLSRLTFGDDGDLLPRWTPDGESVLFTTFGATPPTLSSKNADGTGTADVLLALEQPITEGRWTPDGEWLLVRTGRNAANVRDIWGLRPAVDSVPVPFLTEQFDETSPTVSPDGKWLAYASNETGRYEVYVRPFPDTDAGRWQVSTNGGTEPVWAHSGRELFYLGPSEMIAAQVTTEPAFNRGEQRALFSHGSEYVRGNTYSAYDVSPDDQRFVMIRNTISAAGQVQDSTRLMLVENWFEELKAKVGN
jgi:serine/threonine-protein kinase